MSALMDPLLAAQMRARGEPIPVAEAVEYVPASERVDALARRVADLSAENADLKAKISRITAASSLTPRPGFVIAHVPIRGTSVYAVVEAYYQAPEAATRDEPGDPGECWADRLLISTRDGDRLVCITDLIDGLSDEAVTKAVEAMR